jgi:hypothetical protein
VHALIFTAVVSRHMFMWLSLRQTLDDVIAGCEAAWVFFGGIFKVLIPDNMKPVVINADPVNPTFSDGWLDYAQARGFGTDPARVRSPKDKPRVERVVQYVRGNFFAGETFLDLPDAQRRVEHWCRVTAGSRVHGTTAQRPAEHFAADEAHLLLPAPEALYDVPVFARPKVARDRHVEIAKALYSVPGELIGQHLHARADSRLVRLYHRGQLIKTHPRKPPGGDVFSKLSKLETLPHLSDTTVRAMALANNPDATLADMAALIRRDSVLKKVPVAVVTSRVLSQEERDRLGERAQAVLEKSELSADRTREILARVGL